MYKKQFGADDDVCLKKLNQALTLSSHAILIFTSL